MPNTHVCLKNPWHNVLWEICDWQISDWFSPSGPSFLQTHLAMDLHYDGRPSCKRNLYNTRCFAPQESSYWFVLVHSYSYCTCNAHSFLLIWYIHLFSSARLSGTDPDDEELEEVEELERLTSLANQSLWTRLKKMVLDLVERVGFFGILVCASVSKTTM